MIIRGVVVDTRPASTWNSASKGRHASASHSTEMGNFLRGEALRIMIGVTGIQHIFCRTNEGYTTDIRPHINLARKVKSDRMQALATTKIVRAAQSKHRMACRCNRQ